MYLVDYDELQVQGFVELAIADPLTLNLDADVSQQACVGIVVSTSALDATGLLGTVQVALELKVDVQADAAALEFATTSAPSGATVLYDIAEPERDYVSPLNEGFASHVKLFQQYATVRNVEAAGGQVSKSCFFQCFVVPFFGTNN